MLVVMGLLEEALFIGQQVIGKLCWSAHTRVNACPIESLDLSLNFIRGQTSSKVILDPAIGRLQAADPFCA